MTQEFTDINYPISKCNITALKPNYMLSFHKEGTQVGTFDFNEGKMHFEGELSESGKVFVDWVLGAFKQRLDDAILAEREACAKVAQDESDWNGDVATIADLIRARGQA
jgi:hypothetical protein